MGGNYMYRQVEPALRMTSNEACVRYPDEFILMRMDSMNPSDDMGTVLYVGDDGAELSFLVMELDDPTNCGVTEGLNHQRRSLGGVVVGEWS
jgi:hypothetical protein